MKIQIDRDAFAEAMGRVSPAVPARSPKPVLTCVKLVATPDGVTLTATDLEIGISCLVDLASVRVETPGAVLLPTSKVAAVLKASRDEWLTLELRDDQLIITGDHSRYEFPTEPAEHFPDVPAFDAAAYRVVASADLKRLIRRTSYATDETSTRFALSGCLMEAVDGTLALVGTDGRRLARSECPADVEGEPAETEPPVVPLKALKLIDRNLDDSDPPVHVATDGRNSVQVRSDRVTIWSRVVDGRFPRYQDVFPGEPSARVTIPAGELLAAYEQAAIATSEESRGVDAEFSPGTLTLSASAPERGKSRVTLPAALEGEPVSVTLLAQFVAEALRTLPAETPVEVRLIDSKSAVLLEADGNTRVVIMPMTRDR